MRLPGWSPPREISENGCWIWVHCCWMYIADSLMELVWLVITEWKQDQHLWG